MVRLPANVINKLSHLNKEISNFESINEREPVFGEIEVKNNEIMNLVSYPKCSSLNEVINENGDELIELIASEEEESVILDERLKKELDVTLSILDKREREIVESYFGLNSESEPMTLEAIGERYGLTKERIRQIKEKALRKLRYNTQNLFNLRNE